MSIYPDDISKQEQEAWEEEAYKRGLIKSNSSGCSVQPMVSNTQKGWIETAKKLKQTNPHLANYVLRDLEVLEMAGLRDLSWEMYKGHSENESDVDYLIQKLEEYINIACHEHC